MRIVLFAATRPNLVKIAALYHAFRADPEFDVRVVYANQHYDENLSGNLYRQLGLPAGHIRLTLPEKPRHRQTAELVVQFGQYLAEQRPDWVLVTGDVDATLSAALAARQTGVPLAHVEAGLRSLDRNMPEERNRIATDALADLHFVSEPSGLEHLRREGYAPDSIYLVGNVMIDTLYRMLPEARMLSLAARLPEVPGTIWEGPYFTVTLHRPSNVDTRAGLLYILDILQQLANRAPIVFPVHPRTTRRLEEYRLTARFKVIPGLFAVPSLDYLTFIRLMSQSALIMTDSGGVQEESTCLGVPCLTLRANTERPATIQLGTNVLASDPDPVKIGQFAARALAGKWKKGESPALWDGSAALRIADVLKKIQNNRMTCLKQL